MTGLIVACIVALVVVGGIAIINSAVGEPYAEENEEPYEDHYL